MYFMRVWECIECRFRDVFFEGLGGVLCVGLGLCFVRVWGCIVCRFGLYFESLGMYCGEVRGCIL